MRTIEQGIVVILKIVVGYIYFAAVVAVVVAADYIHLAVAVEASKMAIVASVVGIVDCIASVVAEAQQTEINFAASSSPAEKIVG